MNGVLLAKGKEHDVITYVAVKLLKTSFYNNFHVSDVTTTLSPSITYQHLQMWPAINLLQITICRSNKIQNASDVRHLFCATVLDQVRG